MFELCSVVVDTKPHEPIMIMIVYGILAALYAYEGIIATKRIITMHLYELVKVEPLLYILLISMAIGTILMALRTVINVFSCGLITMTILRVLSNAILIFAIYLSNRMLWIMRIEIQYPLWPLQRRRRK